jgi:hypothetical protein
MFKNWDEVLAAIQQSPELFKGAVLKQSNSKTNTNKFHVSLFHVVKNPGTIPFDGEQLSTSQLQIAITAQNVRTLDKPAAVATKTAKAATLSLAELRERL